MIREITIGQYYPADSLMHRMDPRVKLFGTMFFLIAVFSFRGIVGFALVTLFLAGMVRLSKVPFSYMVKGLRAIAVLMAMTAFFHIFLTNSPNVIWEWKWLHITEEGVQAAVKMMVRLIYLILGTSIMTLTTTPNELTDGLEKALKPLQAFHVPVHEIAMMMAIALRFIPILIEETDKVMRAQMARGADFESGNLVRRAKAMAPLLVPLFVAAFRRANDLAMAMEARCYRGGAGRTKMKPLTYAKRDYVGYLLVVAFFVAVIMLRRVSVVSWILLMMGGHGDVAFR